MVAIKQVADEIKKQANAIKRKAAKYKFEEALIQLDALLHYIEKQDKTFGANPPVHDFDEEWAYPPDYHSSYLLNSRPDDVLSAIAEEAEKYRCACEPIDCECWYGEDGTNQLRNLSCHFCNCKIAAGDYVVTLDHGKQKICSICDDFFQRKAQPEFSAKRAIDDLIHDAVIESTPPWYQFSKTKILLEKAKDRCEELCKAPIGE